MIYNAAFLAQQIQKDKRYIIVGKANYFKGKTVFRHPEVVETESPEAEAITHNIGRLYPIYPELHGIKPHRFAKKIWEQMPHISEYFEEIYPEAFRKKYKLLPIVDTVRQMHYPEKYAQKQKAQYRIFFDRLLRIQLYSQRQKQSYQQEHSTTNDIDTETPDRSIVKKFIAQLPFTLTQAQKKVTKTIIENLHDKKQMVRLLQGDV